LKCFAQLGGDRSRQQVHATARCRELASACQLATDLSPGARRRL